MRGLIGYPLGHSYSKIIQENINHKTYDLIELDEDAFEDFMKKKEFECINVTIPYKQKVLSYLDEISDEAKRIGAINCIINRNGKLSGYNSDYYGLRWMIEHHQFDLKNKTVAILGNGGACKACKEVSKDLEAKAVYVVSRKKSDETITYDEFYELDPDIIINATPVGMYPHNDECVISFDTLKNTKGVIDIIYNPLRTKLVIEAEKHGIKAICGLEMLVGQAVKAIEWFDDTEVDHSVIDRCLEMLRKDKQNVVLIGMPSCGKTTLSKMISETLKMEVIDTDEEITKRIEMPISDYFKKYSEAAFRKIETDVVRSLRNEHGKIISCGGGVIKDELNMDHLKENGIIVFIDRDLDKLVSTDDRPLSNNEEKLRKLYKERFHLYKRYADVIIKNNDSIDNAVLRIIQEVKDYDHNH